ncbi:hypothetical protein [Priestia megaterium]|uniref:hypothetical protein n=1 Tax=Priestia megaterium TaxID=1404 RepID=UPI0023D992A6|nr:hypothetical protein [Priestia megaterium]MDF2013279.1 hypothetical protein [Priestia megaterium]
MFLKLLLIISIFSNWLEEWIPLFTFSDEALAVIFFLLGLIKLLTTKKPEKVFTKLEVTVFILTIFVSFIGILSTIQSDIHNTFSLQMYTLFANVKFVLIYFGGRVLIKHYSCKNIENIGIFTMRLSYLFSIICLFFFIVDKLFNFMHSFGYRFGFKNIAYGFGHPAEFSLAIILFTALNLFFNLYLKHKINYVYIILNLFLLFTAGRVTAIAFFLLLIILILFFRYFRKYVFGGLIISSICAVAFIFDKFKQTFVNIQEPRGILMVTSIEIAKRFFPFGSGLGTFGSNASRINYSQLYYEYGFTKIWGLAPWYDVFLTDSYWAMIIGELGFIAAFINLLLLLLLLINAYRISKGIFGIIISFPAIYMVISSPVDTTIVANSSLPLMFVTSLLVTLRLNEINKNG